MILIVDPPWPQKKGGLRKVAPNQTRYIGYKTMPVSDIFDLLDTVFPQEPHCVFLWGIDKFLHDGEGHMRDRGYRLHARLIWDKMNGVSPAFTIRYSHEYCSWFYKPKLIPIEKSQRGKFRSVIQEPSRQHSRKPDAIYKIVEALYPNEEKMDVFSRERRDGWMQFGDQCDYFKDMK